MKLLIFDLDGTLIDSAQMILAAHTRGFASMGLAKPADDVLLSAVGLSLPETFVRVCGADAPVEALSAAYKKAWRALLDEGHAPPLYASAEETVRHLQLRGHVMGIATGKTRKGVDDILLQYGWGQVFRTIHTADSARSKPDPDMILQALQATGFTRQNCLMIGDTSFDMDMAKAAGVGSIGVSWGFHGRADIGHADHVVDDFAALLRAIEDF